MPGENIGSLVVKLEGDLTQLRAALDSGQVDVARAARQMGDAMKGQAREAKDSFELLGETIGVRIPRELRRTLAEIPAVGTVMAKLFPIAAVGAFAVVIGERLLPQLQKAYNYIESLTTAQRHAAEEQSLREHIAAMVKQAQDLDRQLRLAGLSGAARAAEEKKIYQEQLEGAEGRVRRIQYEIAKLNEVIKEGTIIAAKYVSTGPGKAGAIFVEEQQSIAAKQAVEDLRVKYLELDAATLEVLVNQKNLGITTKEYVVAANKEAAASAREHAAALDALLKAQVQLAELTTKQNLNAANLRPVERPYLLPEVPQLQFPELVPPVPRTPLYSGTKEAAELNKLLTDQGERLKYIQEMYSGSRTLAEQYAFEVQKLNIAYGDRRNADYYAALEKIRQQYDENLIAVRELGLQMGQAFQQGILMGRDWSDILKTVLVDIINLIAKMTILKSLNESSRSSGGGGVAGFFSSLLGGLFGGGRAVGGSVYAGAGYIVGERGPEFFSPSSNGFILPHSALQAAGGGPSIQIDARGADAAVEYKLEKVAQKLLKAMPGIAVAAVREYSSRH